jgi:hypothetical protein
MLLQGMKVTIKTIKEYQIEAIHFFVTDKL